MPREDYDVNVHPTKIEVRFYNANLVHSQILGAIREKLLATNLQIQAKLPSTAAASTEKRTAGSHRNQKIADAMAEFFKKHRPIQTQQQLGFRPATGKRPPYKETHYIEQVGKTQTQIEPQRQFIQILDSFIIAEADDGFIIIDQHALHERIMYENLCSRIKKNNLESQKLLIPETFELTNAAADILQANTELFERLGIELTAFGPKTMAIQAFPTMLAKAEPVDFVRDLIDLLNDKAAGLDREQLLDEIMNMAACKAAIKAGQKLTDSEIQQLLSDKETLERASRCPHGRPTTIKFSIDELEKQFKRT
jgi:DNA mismatch repair protein MutL